MIYFLLIWHWKFALFGWYLCVCVKSNFHMTSVCDMDFLLFFPSECFYSSFNIQPSLDFTRMRIAISGGVLDISCVFESLVLFPWVIVCTSSVHYINFTIYYFSLSALPNCILPGIKKEMFAIFSNIVFSYYIRETQVYIYFKFLT